MDVNAYGATELSVKKSTQAPKWPWAGAFCICAAVLLCVAVGALLKPRAFAHPTRPCSDALFPDKASCKAAVQYRSEHYPQIAKALEELRAANITILAREGTLLSALRQQGWQPFDADMDVFVWERDQSRFDEIAGKHGADFSVEVLPEPDADGMVKMPWWGKKNTRR